LAASLAWYFAHVSEQVLFVAPGFRESSDVWEFLHYLALAKAGGAGSILEDLRDNGEFNLIVSRRSAAELTPALRSTSRICAW
jgi:hypothetical protein